MLAVPTRLAGFALASSLLFAATVKAQEVPNASAAGGQEALATDTQQTLLERDRDWIRAGHTPDVIGLEQGDNEFRSGTPSLTRGKLETAEVDLEDLRARRLAMYDDGIEFDRGFRSEPPVQNTTLVRTASEKLADEGKDGFPWILPVGLLALAVVGFRNWLAER